MKKRHILLGISFVIFLASYLWSQGELSHSPSLTEETHPSIKKPKEENSPNKKLLDIEAIKTERMREAVQSSLPVSGVLYAFEQSGDEEVLNEFLEALRAEDLPLREKWIGQMPPPKNPIQEILLYTLSASQFSSQLLGPAKEAMEAVGTSLDQIEGKGVEEYLTEVLERSRELEDYDLLANAHRYNSIHTINYKIGKDFKNDVEKVINGNVRMTDQNLMSLIEALLANHQMPSKERLEKASSLITQIEDQNLQATALELINKDLAPLAQ